MRNANRLSLIGSACFVASGSKIRFTDYFELSRDAHEWPAFLAVELLALVDRVAVLRAVVLFLAVPLLALVDFAAVVLFAVVRFAVVLAAPDLALVDFEAVLRLAVVDLAAVVRLEVVRLAAPDLALVDFAAGLALAYFAAPALAWISQPFPAWRWSWRLQIWLWSTVSRSYLQWFFLSSSVLLLFSIVLLVYVSPLSLGSLTVEKGTDSRVFELLSGAR